jgi:hypothetical protein
MVEEMRIAYKILVGKPERRIPLSRSRGKWRGDINLDESNETSAGNSVRS